MAARLASRSRNMAPIRLFQAGTEPNSWRPSVFVTITSSELHTPASLRSARTLNLILEPSASPVREGNRPCAAPTTEMTHAALHLLPVCLLAFPAAIPHLLAAATGRRACSETLPAAATALSPCSVTSHTARGPAVGRATGATGSRAPPCSPPSSWRRTRPIRPWPRRARWHRRWARGSRRALGRRSGAWWAPDKRAPTARRS